MFKRLTNSKTKLLAVIFCFVLSVSMLFTGAFMLTTKSASADEVASVTAEFKAEAGAAIRYNTETPGIRFVASVNKEQYDAWTNEYGTDGGYTFKMYIQVEGLKDQDGKAIGGESGIGYYSGIPSEGDITKWDFDKGDFKFGGAIYLETAWADGTAKTAAEIYNMYAEAEFSVAHLEAYYGDAKIATGDVTADTARTIRSVATALFVEEMGENTDIQLGYLVNEFGNASIVSNSSLKYFYDRAADTLKVSAGEIDSTEGFTFRLGAKDVTANVTVADGYITLSGVKEFITAGETYSFNADNGAGIVSYNNIIGATEIIYTADRMKELFKLSAGGDLFTDEKKVTESVTVDGTTYSATFYNDKIDNPEWFRGYYVLGNDIDYGYTFKNTNGFVHGAIVRATTYNGVNASTASGLFGFGGTFDGNGYAIKNASFDGASNSIRAQGLFGALAYGATVKNVALTNVVRSGQESQRSTHLIATFTGGATTANDYLMAKYGTTDTVLISDIYVQLSTTTDYNTSKKNPFNQDEDGNYLGEYDFYNMKQEKNDDTDDGVYYTSGTFGLTYNANANYMSMENVVLDMPNSGMTPICDNDYFGFYTDRDAENTAAAIENSVLISANSTDKYASGKIQAVRLRQPAVIWNEETSAIKGLGNSFSRTYKVYDLVLGGDLHKETFAANDYAALVEAGVIVSGSDKINMTFVDGTMTYNAVDDTHSANTTVYAASGINRYDSLTAMAAAETSTDLTAYNTTYWDTTSGAPVWRSGDNKGFEATIDTSHMVTVGTEITVTSTMGSEDVTASTAIGVQDGEVLSVSGNKITATATGTSMISVIYYDGTMNQEYIKFITIDVINAVTDKIYISADASKIEGSESEWSTPYIANANGKDYDKTDLTSIYRAATDSSDATITGVYQVVMGKNTKLVTSTDDDGNLSVAFDAEGKLTDIILMIYGTNGIIYLNNVSIVTAVLSEAADYLYVNTTATTRAGYYVIANDFDAMPANVTNNQYNNLLNTASSTGQMLAFSFGSWDSTIDKPRDGLTTTFTNGGFYAPFVGTIDGLGHTVNNVETRKEGLLGAYTDQYQTATLKNVQFTNLKSTYTTWEGAYNDGKKVLSYREYFEQIIARMYYKTAVRFVDTNLITLENVVISMDKDYNHYRDNSQYKNNLKLSENQLFYNVTTNDNGSTSISNLDGPTRWSFIYYGCESNTSYMDMGEKKFDFVNTVLEYKINDGAGLWSVNYGGENVIAHKDEAAGGQLVNIMEHITAGLDGLTLIVDKTHSGRVASAFYGHGSSGYASLICLAKNDFERLFPDATDGKTTDAYYMGYASEEDTTWTYSTDAASVGKYITISNRSTFQFFTKDFYRYDSVSDAINQGVTQIGNYQVTADGFVWAPAS